MEEEGVISLAPDPALFLEVLPAVCGLRDGCYDSEEGGWADGEGL